eukprot:gnl/TRDRNA2_/TRDRNA2_75626_c0_seq2.p2 gnl/TRDRNA2_/TRDRNA2_75626_c0~~gnl/TRDRNA2_/TRDRNA2_75626_c0_seq2.p2  ORF type:complete len:112 (+),score=20.34 gnl/TRDRNA2_/TRDRNA2_75626_c0_seq2:414-749(+)
MLARGFYAPQLRRLFGLYGRSQALVLISERFRARPHETLRKVAVFLGIEALDAWADGAEALEERHVRRRMVPPLEPSERAELCDLYAADVAELKTMLSDDLPEWEDFAVRS